MILTVGVAGMPPNKMSGSKYRLRSLWSPLIKGGSANGKIHAWERAVARRLLPAITSIVLLPHWCVAGFVWAGYLWWCKSMRSVSVNSHMIFDFESSTSSFAYMPISTSLSCCHHCLICATKSSMNCLHGFGSVFPCCKRRQDCWAVTVLEVVSKV